MEFITAVKRIAPMIAGTLGTPLAGLAVQAIAATLPTEQDNEIQTTLQNNGVSGVIEKLSDMLQAGTINTAQIKQAEQAHAERMAELGYKNAQELERIALEDRKDARALQRDTRSAIPGALALLVTLGFFGILAAMITGTFKPADNQSLLIMLGALSAAWGAIVQYYFGSSASSARKDETFATVVAKK